VTWDTEFGPASWVAGVSEPGKYTFETVTYNIEFDGLEAGSKATLIVLTAPDDYSANTVAGDNVVKSEVTQLTAGSKGFAFELENYSVAVLTTLETSSLFQYHV
jgi:alpha-N-arabinofuranosidase